MVAGFIILPINTYFAKKIFKKIAIFSRHKINADTKRSRRQQHIPEHIAFPLQSFYFLFIYPPHAFWTIFFRFISFTYICETTKIHFQ